MYNYTHERLITYNVIQADLRQDEQEKLIREMSSLEPVAMLVHELDKKLQVNTLNVHVHLLIKLIMFYQE